MSNPSTARRTFEYSTVPLITHATKAILDTWGEDGWELVQVVPGPEPGAVGGVPEAGTGMTVKDRLAELGIELPAVAAAAGSYLPSVQSGNLLFTAGQLPFVDGRLPATGRVGAEVSPEDAKEYARVCGLNLLAAVDAAVGLDKVERVVKVVGFVASAEGFTGQPGVINGVSDLFAEVFGEAGRHARSAVGVAELPLGAPVEVEAIVQVG